MKGGLLLDVVVREGAAVLELLAREDETLLIRGDACERRGRGSSLSRLVHLMCVGQIFALGYEWEKPSGRARGGTAPRHEMSAAARAQAVLPSTFPTDRTPMRSAGVSCPRPAERLRFTPQPHPARENPKSHFAVD